MSTTRMGRGFLRNEANSGSLRGKRAGGAGVARMARNSSKETPAGSSRRFSRMDWRQCDGVELHMAARRPKAWLCPIRRPRPRVLVGKSDCIRDSLGPLKLQRFSEGALLKLKPVISRRPLKLRRF